MVRPLGLVFHIGMNEQLVHFLSSTIKALNSNIPSSIKMSYWLRTFTGTTKSPSSWVDKEKALIDVTV